MTEPFFPFTIHAREGRNSVHSPSAFRATFMKHRKEQVGDRTWYGYHVDVLSSTRVRFHVFKMREPMFGGIGEIFTNFEVDVPSLVTVPAIYDHALELARRRREAELEEKEARIIEDYTREIIEEAVGRRLTARRLPEAGTGVG